jgi:hypothetical protein
MTQTIEGTEAPPVADRLEYAFALFGFYGVPLFIMNAYNISREKHAQNLATLAARNANA